MYVRYAYIIKDHSKYEQGEDTIIGICSTSYYAERHVENYIKRVYCYGTDSFDIYKTKMDEDYAEVLVKHYSYDDVVELAKKFGVYPQE